MTNKKPRRKPTKPLTPLQQAELVDHLPFGKINRKMARQLDRHNAQLGMKSRAGKLFDLATGLELTQKEVNRRVEEAKAEYERKKIQRRIDDLRRERVNVPPDEQAQYDELIQHLSNYC